MPVHFVHHPLVEEVLARLRFKLFFFFQAEDGIRDKLVTGVQTCALPIYYAPVARPARSARRSRHPTCRPGPRRARRDRGTARLARARDRLAVVEAPGDRDEIGRASCRERV